MKNRFLFLIVFCWISLPLLAQETNNAEGMYTGDTRRGLRHGRGTCIWPDGSRYEGYWREGFMYGKGKLTYQGNTYDGDWVNGKKHGRGKLTFADGTVYEGEFRSDQMEGYGTLTMPDGSKHEGLFVKNMTNGYGKHTWATGSVYVGDWKDNMMHGQGTLMYKDGKVEQGSFKNNQFQPCECGPTPLVEDAYKAVDAVFAGKVISILSDPEGFDDIIIEVEQYWKGELGLGRRVLLRAAYTSCDVLFYEGESYLVYAVGGGNTIYHTGQCTRTVSLAAARYDLEELKKVVPCTNEEAAKNAVISSGETDFVCGCDGVTYRNPSRASKAGVGYWRIGKCEGE